MLEHQVTELTDRFIQVEFDERRKILKRAVLDVAERMNSRGLFHSSIHLDQGISACGQEIDVRARIVLQFHIKVLADLAVAPYENLAQDLKERLRYFLSHHSDYTQHAGDLAVRLNLSNRLQALATKWEQAIKRTEAEIDLFVTGHLRRKTGQFPTQLKEIDQKFKILMSAGQARLDFEGWAKELGAAGGSIAILFVDIDNFKGFNSKHTETVIDETILPDAMRLIHKMVNQRGGAYKQGGDEFVLILPNHNSEEAAAFAEKLLAAFQNATFTVKNAIEHLTVSIGVAFWPLHGQTYDEVLKKANQAKAQAKGTRNTTVIANS